MRVKQDADLSERPEQLDEDDEPPGKASAVQAGAAWDKARVNGQGISLLHILHDLVQPRRHIAAPAIHLYAAKLDIMEKMTGTSL